MNPHIYRGYRYDSETGLYYLQSMYYNPEICRMLNADALGGQVGILLSHNLFAYCMNNTVNMYDPSGYFAIADFIKASIPILPFIDGLAPVGDLLAIVLGICVISQDNSVPDVKTEDVTTQENEDEQNIIVYRVWGVDTNNPDYEGYSLPWGHSWTPVNPSTVLNYRNIAGLPSGGENGNNMGRFVTVGKVINMTGVTIRPALQLDGNNGGLEEWIFPNPRAQIKIIGVYGVTPRY